jgi:hypothetical protein
MGVPLNHPKFEIHGDLRIPNFKNPPCWFEVPVTHLSPRFLQGRSRQKHGRMHLVEPETGAANCPKMLLITWLWLRVAAWNLHWAPHKTWLFGMFGGYTVKLLLFFLGKIWGVPCLGWRTECHHSNRPGNHGNHLTDPAWFMFTYSFTVSQ